MKKIAIITRHAVPNYGSLYQAYALQEAIKKINNEPFIVDAEYSYYSADKISKDAMKTSKYKKIPIINIISYLIKYVRYSKPIKIFRIYQKKWLNLSRQYTDKEEFYKNYPKADIYMIGSDQVWNIMPDGKIESMYFLDFVKDKTKKVSYAASFGSEKKIKTELADITNYLKDFDKITVRENDGLRILRENGVLGEQVLDPTLLLNINDWNLVMENINLPNEYILLYQVNHNKDLCKKAAAFAKRKGMKLIRVTNDMSEIFWGEGFTYLPTPAQFLYIIKNAKYVITDSFHGTCFCINFNKNFIDVLPENHSQRNRSVLDFFDLTDRIISDDKFDFVEQSIDWSKVNNILMEQRKISMIELKSLCEI